MVDYFANIIMTLKSFVVLEIDLFIAYNLFPVDSFLFSLVLPVKFVSH